MEKTVANGISKLLEPTEEQKERIFKNILTTYKNEMIEKRRVISMKGFKPTLVAIASALCLLTTTAFAAWYFLRPSEVAERFEDITLSQVLESENAIYINKSITSGEHTFTLLVLVSGKNLTDWPLTGDSMQPERTYAVAAVHRIDGEPMLAPSDDEYDSNLFFATPMIKGLNPRFVNIFAMNGANRMMVEDGTTYCIMSFDDLSMFARHGVYVGICTGTSNKRDAFSAFLSEDAFIFDEQTGVISVNPQYNGTSVLIDMPFEESQADNEKIEKYLNDNYEAFFPNGDNDFKIFKNSITID